MRKYLSLCLLMLLVFTLTGCDLFNDQVIDEGGSPEISCKEDTKVLVNSSWSIADMDVTAYDDLDGDITSSINVTGDVDTQVPGEYPLIFTVKNDFGVEVSMSCNVEVIDLDITYPTGLYNYKFADSSLRQTFLAAAEKWLLENQAGGVPLFASGSFLMFSQRTTLPVEEYITVMGYGPQFGTFTADDSTVKMYDGEYGNVGEYTFRDRSSTNPHTFNQWLYDTSTDEDYMKMYYSSLYSYHFNSTKTGYEVVPSMASSNPTSIDSRVTETGKEVSSSWQIKLRDDLEFYFHPNITTETGFEPNDYDTTIKAKDFVDTFKLALDNNWFRAVSGGGDFYGSASAIEGVKEYVDGSGSWDDVGFHIVDEHTIEFTFVDEQSEWNVKYFLSGFVISPISLDLYNYLENHKENDINPYGKDIYSIGYHGPYYIDDYKPGTIVRMIENPNYHSPDEFTYTGYDFMVIEDSNVMFQEFLNGKLDVSPAPTSEVVNYYGSNKLYRVPGPTVYRLMINSLKTEEAQRELFPDGTWVPEPLLGNDDFKDAMFFAIDRQKLAEDVLKVRTTSMYYFSDIYIYDVEQGIPFRKTEQGKSVGVNMYPETHGFNSNEATKLFKKAIDDLVNEGYYEEGTNDNWNIITIELNNYSDSASWDLAVNFIKESFESAFVYPEKHIKVELDIYTKDFPEIYYDYMMMGEFDLSVGGISSCTLCGRGSLLDNYSSDNRSGFFLNPGVDTSKAEIEVIYYDLEGFRHREMWSFDAIASVLHGEIYLEQGEEGEVPQAVNIEVTETTLDFVIQEFENENFNNISYMLEYYDFETDTYKVVEGYENVPANTKEISITGLEPYNFAFDENRNIVYKGDYQITVFFGYVGYENDVKKTISPWFEMQPLVKHDELIITDTTVDIDNIIVNNSDGLNRVVVSYELLEEKTDGTYDSFLKTEGELTDQIKVSALVPETQYILKITFDNSEIHYIEFETEKTPIS